MKKTHIVTGMMISAIVLLAACGGTQKKTDQKKVDTEPMVQSNSTPIVVTTVNNQLDTVSIDGFNGNSSKLKNRTSVSNMVKIVKMVKPLIDKLPDGYVMVIRGHCANFLPQSRISSVSKMRARTIYNQLRKAGVPASKIKWRGLGVEQLLSDYDGKDAKQRRVSFKAEKK